MVLRFPGSGLIPKFLQNGKGGKGKAQQNEPSLSSHHPHPEAPFTEVCEHQSKENAASELSSGESALGEIITPGRAPNEPLCLYEPLFPLLMDQLSFTKSCFCKARGKNTFEYTEVRPHMVRAPWERCQNPAVIYPGQLHRQC